MLILCLVIINIIGEFKMTAMIVGGKLDGNSGEKTKKHNKTFSLSPDDVAFLTELIGRDHR